MFSWFSTPEGERFGKELARFLLQEFSGSMGKAETKFSSKVERALLRADRQVADFKKAHQLNFIQRAKLSNAFLWTLKDGGCDPEYADKLTEWLSIRL